MKLAKAEFEYIEHLDQSMEEYQGHSYDDNEEEDIPPGILPIPYLRIQCTAINTVILKLCRRAAPRRRKTEQNDAKRQKTGLPAESVPAPPPDALETTAFTRGIGITMVEDGRGRN